MAPGPRVTKATPGADKVDCGPSPVWYGKYTLPTGEVRRAKLYFLRDRVGKSVRLKERRRESAE